MRLNFCKVLFFISCLLISLTSSASPFLIQSTTDTIKKSTNAFLTEKVHYTATDSMQVDMLNQKAYLFNNAEVIYEDMKMNAGYIEIDFKNNLVRASGIKDSAGRRNHL